MVKEVTLVEESTGEGNCGEEEYRSLRNMQVKRIVSAPHAVISTAVLSILIIISWLKDSSIFIFEMFCWDSFLIILLNQDIGYSEDKIIEIKEV